ncbi:MAG TPA: hypothetical protein VF975_09175 [Thermoanaerobaculia bacterium]
MRSWQKLLLAGWALFVVFVVLLYFVAPRSETSFLTRAIVFMVLIPPPVCFAAGIFSSFAGETPVNGSGAWSNAAAIVLHGIAAIPILQSFFALA